MLNVNMMLIVSSDIIMMRLRELDWRDTRGSLGGMVSMGIWRVWGLSQWMLWMGTNGNESQSGN